MSLPSLWSETEPRTPEGAQTTRYLGTADQIAKLIKRAPARTRVYVSVRNDAPIVDPATGNPTDTLFRAGLSAALLVSRVQALHMVADMLGPVLQQRGARIPAHLYERERGDGSPPYRALYIGA